MAVITIIVCIKRKPGMTQEAFTAYWSDVHAPTLLACTDFTRHILSYVQHHLVVGGTAVAALFGASGDYDGVAALTFANEAALAAAFAEPKYITDVRPDEFNFVDIENCTTLLTSPFVVKAA
ncbi:EthD domain-containing protein [Sphingomonas sp. TF3]|uniref:EthD domain-containing protein n=1 Tax=Sphingomonas sp. TF3 TaxID=2495580 RepID=UPI00163BD22E|nr:EthD domain-containing protein [Sphingomonas sp. TF3]